MQVHPYMGEVLCRRVRLAVAFWRAAVEASPADRPLLIFSGTHSHSLLYSVLWLLRIVPLLR